MKREDIWMVILVVFRYCLPHRLAGGCGDDPQIGNRHKPVGRFTQFCPGRE